MTSLSGQRILVTRPPHQAKALVDKITGCGGQAIEFPVLEIAPRPNVEIRAEIAGQASPDIVIFVSANAVEYGLDDYRHSAAAVAAIGPTTARSIRAAGHRVDIVPEGGFDSSHLLGTPALDQVAGKTITIVRGQSGRELLAETLRHRGARVQYLTVYRRTVRTIGEDETARLERTWHTAGIDAVLIMSVATLDALLDVLPAACHEYLRRSLLVAPSERVIQTALERLPGVRCFQAPGPTPDDIVAALADGLHEDPDHPHD